MKNNQELLEVCENLCAALTEAIFNLKNASTPSYGPVNPYNRFPLLGKMEVTLKYANDVIQSAK